MITLRSEARRPLVLAMIATLAAAAGCSAKPDASRTAPPQYLFVWAGPHMSGMTTPDSAHAPPASDFIAVLDADSASSTYGRVLATTPVAGAGAMAHHTEFILSSARTLFADDYLTGRVSIFDLASPLAPRVAGTIESVPGYRRPHSFARLANGHVIATLQFGNGSIPGDPGGLGEFDASGRLLRVSSSADPAFKGARIRTYSIEVLPVIGRVVTTSTPMDSEVTAHVIQLWRLSDLRLLRTIAVPKVEGDSLNYYPFEVRALLGGRTAMLNTYYCGFYLLSDMDTEHPRIELVLALRRPLRIGCAVPVIVGRYEVVPIAYAHEIVSLDLTDPAKPVEVGGLRTDSTFLPHWSSPDARSDRIVVTGQGDGEARVMMIRLDRANGRLSWDERFRESGATRRGVSFDRTSWPHGPAGPAMPHGAVFEPGAR